MAADARHGLGLDLGEVLEQRDGGHQVVGAEAHLHGAARIGARGDRPAEGEDMDARFGHWIFRERKKRSASGPVAVGPRKASEMKRCPLSTESWRSWLPLASAPVDSTAVAPPTSRQLAVDHLPPASFCARTSSAACRTALGCRVSTSAG